MFNITGKRDGKRWKEMERDGKRWKEMERDGKRWKEVTYRRSQLYDHHTEHTLHRSWLNPMVARLGVVFCIHHLRSGTKKGGTVFSVSYWMAFWLFPDEVIW